MAYPDASVSNRIFLLLSGIANIGGFVRATGVKLQEIPQLIIIYGI